MISKSLQSLLQRSGIEASLRLTKTLGVAAALILPLLALVAGAIVHTLVRQDASNRDSDPGFAVLLPNLADFVDSEMPTMLRISVFIGVALSLVVISGWILYWFYSRVQAAAVAFEVSLIQRLREQGKSLARLRTLSAQQQALTDGLNYHLPRVRSGLARWWRTFPRHIVQLAACVLVAFLIEPMLALLTVIGAGLTLLVYRLLDRARRTTLPVIRERATLHRGHLVDLSLKGPLLESVHQAYEVDRRFNEELEHYRRDAIRSLTSSSWKTPVIFLVGGILVSLFLFVISVRIVGAEASFGVGGALAFALCCCGSAVSLVRLQKAWREMQGLKTAAEELDEFLAIPVEEFANEELKHITRVRREAELEHVTVQDSRGRKLLDNVSVKFTPGKLIGVVANQPIQARALVELLLGYGRPVSGRLMIDGEVVTDLKPESLSQCSHWVAADGAVVTGSVKENVLGSIQRGDAEQIDNAISASRLAETIQQLPEGLATIITPDDDRLGGDASFRIGLARAAMSRPSVVVVEEPRGSSYDPESEQQTLAAIQSLVSDSNITIVLPQRLVTLRNCDMVVMVHEHQITETGTHAELLQRNELYRHLNYLKFNAFRKI